MATQSRLPDPPPAPALLLTRPESQSSRFAKALAAAHPGLRIVISPLLLPRLLSPKLPERPFSALLLTSETGVEAARRIAAEGAALPPRAFCVGARTAAAARAAGFQALSADGDAEALLALVLAQNPPPPLLHLHGRDTRGDLAKRLSLAGIETFSAIAYEQNPQPLTPEAVALLRSATPVIAPVFSPRSAQILAAECARIGATAPLSVIAISPSAAAFFPGKSLLSPRPDAEGMMQVIASRLATLNLPPSEH